MKLRGKACILFLSLFFNSCAFFAPSASEQYTKAVANGPFDAIIVPGVPYDSTLDTWSRTMKARVHWAVYLYKKGITKNIIFSGSCVYTPYVEGAIMRSYAIALGAPENILFAETKAEHSTENLYYSYYMAKSLGFEKIALATDPFQSNMLRSYPKKMKVKIDFIPFIVDTLKTMDMRDVTINAEAHKVYPFESIVDRESRYKRIWGTMGKNIERDKEDLRNKK